MDNKYKKILPFVAVAAIFTFAMYRYYTRPNISEIFSNGGNNLAFTDIDGTSIKDSSNINTLRVPPTGFKEYRSETYRFSLFYPEDFTVKEYKESGGAQTITFSDNQEEKSFQIFVLPYSDSQVSEKRFKMDVPSGVIKEPVDVIIDNVRAIAFFSTNSVMGDTREVWFIKNRFLYEVTTYKELDTWLAVIMRNWVFI